MESSIPEERRARDKGPSTAVRRVEVVGTDLSLCGSWISVSLTHLQVAHRRRDAISRSAGLPGLCIDGIYRYQFESACRCKRIMPLHRCRSFEGVSKSLLCGSSR